MQKSRDLHARIQAENWEVLSDRLAGIDPFAARVGSLGTRGKPQKAAVGAMEALHKGGPLDEPSRLVRPTAFSLHGKQSRFHEGMLDRFLVLGHHISEPLGGTDHGHRQLAARPGTRAI